jgi:hypothetical protein
VKTLYGLIIVFLGVGSCTIYDKEFDNPVDFIANNEKGIGAPTLTFYPLTQTKASTETVIVESFIVFNPDSMKSFAGVHLQLDFPQSFLSFDTITPGLFITDTSQATPLFTYTFDGTNTVDIYTYFLDTIETDLLGSGHLANIIFSPLGVGTDSVLYNLSACEMIDYYDNVVELKGVRGAEIIIQ